MRANQQMKSSLANRMIREAVAVTAETLGEFTHTDKVKRLHREYDKASHKLVTTFVLADMVKETKEGAEVRFNRLDAMARMLDRKQFETKFVGANADRVTARKRILIGGRKLRIALRYNARNGHLVVKAAA